MVSSVVEALNQVASRVAKALGEDAGKAIRDLYRDSSGRLKAVIKNIVETDGHRAEEIKNVLGEMDENAARKVGSAASAEVHTAIEKERQRVQVKLRRNLAKIIDPDSPEANRQLKKTSSQLARTLQVSGEQQPGARWAAHHIVPEYHDMEGAKEARQILAKVDIPIVSQENGVWLPPSSEAAAAAGFAGHAHSVIHTDTYGAALRAHLQALGENPSRDDVVRALGEIKSKILDGTFPR